VYAWGRSSDSFTIHRVDVTGTDVVPRRQALRLLRRDYLGGNLFTVTTAKVRDSLSPLPYVAAVTVDRDFPDVLRVHVVEYQPALYVSAGGRWYVVAGDGHVICEQKVAESRKGARSGSPSAEGSTDASSEASAQDASADAAQGATPAAETTGTAVVADAGGQRPLSAKEARRLESLLAGPKGAALELPRMAVAGALVAGAAADDRGVKAALLVLEGLPSSLRRDVAVVEAGEDGGLDLRFAGGPVVVWGGAARSLAKTLALRAVPSTYKESGQACTFVDVSVPDRVLARPLLK
jgi:POTRA domain, FtsQ-type